MASVTPVSRYIMSASCNHARYQSRSSMYIRGLIPGNFADWPKQYRLIDDGLPRVSKGRFQRGNTKENINTINNFVFSLFFVPLEWARKSPMKGWRDTRQSAQCVDCC